jgi:uncharacterized protein YihD (DUF1040 family)
VERLQVWVSEMRDPKRIKRILKLIEKIWTRYPDMRLGQLLNNFVWIDAKGIFYGEDDETEKMLEAYVKDKLGVMKNE